MGIVHPIKLSDCQLRQWKHPKHNELEFDIEIDEKQLQKQIEKKTYEALTRAINRINGK